MIGFIAALALTLGGEIVATSEITLSGQDTTRQSEVEEVFVYGPNRRKQKNVNTPAAVSLKTADELKQSGRHGILGRSLEGMTGIDIMQSGATDFTVNTRGFNNGLNRRLLVLQDGRDVAMPLLGAQEWNSFSLPPDEFASIELVRGPSAALYGANAFNGVLLMRSYAPREVLGTKASFLVGDYNTMSGDVRHAGAIGAWSYKVTAGYRQTLNLARRRDSAQFLEYPGLVPERTPLFDSDRQTSAIYGTFRVDYDFDENEVASFEAGYSRNTDETFVFGLGRTFVPDVERPYLRLHYKNEQWTVHAHWMNRRTLDTMRLLAAAPSVPPFHPLYNPNASNNALWDNSHDIMGDVLYSDSLLRNLYVSAGGSLQHQIINTESTSIPDKVNATFAGVYGQVEWSISEHWQAIATLRYDYASIHPNQLSPRLALVYSPLYGHSFRMSGGRSFQRPNYSELFRSTPAPPPLSPLPGGGFGAPVNFAELQTRIYDTLRALSNDQSTPLPELGLERVAPLAFGNENLSVESNIGVELGYKGIIDNKLSLTIDGYFNQLENFITNFLPGVNPAFPTWQPNLLGEWAQYNDVVRGMVQSAMGSNFSGLTNLNGQPQFVVSNTNMGRVLQFGVDIGAQYYVGENLRFTGNYSWYDFSVAEEYVNLLLPNTSPHRVSLGAFYEEKLFDIGVDWRYVEGFDWLAGSFRGKVPAYAIVNISAAVRPWKDIEIGMYIFNLLNRQHYQIFGGTFMPRIATARVRYSF